MKSRQNQIVLVLGRHSSLKRITTNRVARHSETYNDCKLCGTDHTVTFGEDTLLQGRLDLLALQKKKITGVEFACSGPMLKQKDEYDEP